jgi:hypothetical protein
VMGAIVPFFLRLKMKNKKTPIISRENIVLLHQVLGHIKEKGI